MATSLSKIITAMKSFFTGIRYNYYVVPNPFNEEGLPLLLETKYFDANENTSYGSGFRKASQKDLKKYGLGK